MVLVDTSIWVLAGRKAWSLARYAIGEPVAICPPVVQELLQGTEDAQRFEATRAVLGGAYMLDAPMPLERYEEAARIYLACREAGYTIRSSNDCLIAACAIAHGIPLLCDDRDFVYIARVRSLRVLTRS